MKTKNILWLFIALLMGLMSCKREFNEHNTGSTNQPGGDVTIDAKDLKVPAKFNFETEKELTLRVGVANPSFPGERFVIRVFLNVPSTGDLIATGVTNASTYEYTTTLRVPAYEDFIYIQKINADGSSQYEQVKANKFATALFTGKPDDGQYIFKKSGSGMTCSSGCTSTVNNGTGTKSINNNQTHCFTGTIGISTLTVKSGGTAKICGTGTITNLVVQGTGKVYFLEGSRVSISSFSGNSSSNLVKNWSDSITFTGSVTLPGALYNYGHLYINGALTTNSSSYLRNEGDFIVGGSVSLNDDFRNYHVFTAGGSLSAYSNADVENYCYMKIDGSFSSSADLYNSCFIKVGETLTINSGCISTIVDNGAVISTKNITLNDNIEGTGTDRSKVKVSATTTINSNGQVKGKIDLCDSTGIETNNGAITSPAAASCSGYIAPTTCFPDGYGAPAIQDADSDGIADAQDEYPNDATRAFNSYYPSATSNATLAFEDLWPATGDYDYNDLVLGFNIQKVLNADNKVVDYKVKMKVRAVGAAFDNGFGFQFDELSPSDVQTVTGQLMSKSYITLSANKTEASQTKAVIICYDSPEPSMHRPATGSMFNTIQANQTGTSDTIRVNVTFTSPVVDSKLDISKFNPFIISNGRRGYEVHLGNFKATSLANTNLFGTDQDRTNAGNNVYYKTGNGMPWAILLPVDFDYPVEKTSITSAYNYFDDWAAGGGSTNTDWYTSNPGNRNTSNIYEAH